MNYLSHFYLDRFHPSPYYKLGLVLPDLMRVSNKKVRLHSLKEASHFPEEVNHIIQGSQRHFDVDARFHNSDFFQTHSTELKKIFIKNGLDRKEIRLFFLSHILSEMLLDRQLLLDEPQVGIEFYENLQKIDLQHLDASLKSHSHFNADTFAAHYTRFLKSRYLLSYTNTEVIFYAINRISERIGLVPLLQSDFIPFEKSILESQENIAKTYREFFPLLLHSS